MVSLITKSFQKQFLFFPRGIMAPFNGRTSICIPVTCGDYLRRPTHSSLHEMDETHYCFRDRVQTVFHACHTCPLRLPNTQVKVRPDFFCETRYSLHPTPTVFTAPLRKIPQCPRRGEGRYGKTGLGSLTQHCNSAVDLLRPA